MKQPNLPNRRIAAFVVAICLGGCGGQMLNTNAGLRSAGPASVLSTSVAARPHLALRRDDGGSWVSPKARYASRLLFVSDFASGDVNMYSLPDLGLMGTITGFAEPQGMCSDRHGNVWVADTGRNSVLEYSHAGALLNRISEFYGYPVSCAINPKNGDLAVLNIFDVKDRDSIAPNVSGEWAYVLVYKCPSCTAKVEVVPGMTELYFGSYDNQGNLFVDGLDETQSFQIGAIPRGHTTGHELIFQGGKIYLPGMVEWHKRGGYLVVGDQKCDGVNASCLYSVSVSRAFATVRGETNISNSSGGPVCDLVQGVLDPPRQNVLLGGDYEYCGSESSSVNLWRYPAGGLPIGTTNVGVEAPTGTAVSVR